jgi:hypothetical protein
MADMVREIERERRNETEKPVVKQTWSNIYLDGAKYRGCHESILLGEFVFAEGRLDSGARGILAASRPLIDGEIVAIFLRHHFGGKCCPSPVNPGSGLG